MKFFALSFLCILAAAWWVHEWYMDTYSGEFNLQLLSDKVQNKLIQIESFHGFTFKNQRKFSRFNAKHGNVYANGLVEFFGDLRVVNFGDLNSQTQNSKTPTSENTVSQGKTRGMPSKELQDNARGPFSIETPMIRGMFQLPSEGGLLENKITLESAKIPGKLVIQREGQVITVSAIIYDPTSGNISSKEQIEVREGNGKLLGIGFTYNTKTEDFKVGGKIHGNFYPQLKKK